MPTTIFFDLDDTLLWDKKSIETALEKTAEDAATLYLVQKEPFLQTVKKLAPEIYKTYSFYDYTVYIGINPFEGLWGTFGDPVHVKFRQMGEEITGYQEEMWRKSLAAHGVEAGGAALRSRFITHRMQSPFLYEETIDVLETLKSKGYKLVIVTNGAPSLQLKKLEITPELVRYFDQIVISGNVGEGKPGQPIFDHALRVAGEKAENVWMVGDNLKTDISGANRAGIHSVWIRHDAAKIPGNGDGQPDQIISRLKEIIPLLEK